MNKKLLALGEHLKKLGFKKEGALIRAFAKIAYQGNPADLSSSGDDTYDLSALDEERSFLDESSDSMLGTEINNAETSNGISDIPGAEGIVLGYDHPIFDVMMDYVAIVGPNNLTDQFGIQIELLSSKDIERVLDMLLNYNSKLEYIGKRGNATQKDPVTPDQVLYILYNVFKIYRTQVSKNKNQRGSYNIKELEDDLKFIAAEHSRNLKDQLGIQYAVELYKDRLDEKKEIPEDIGDENTSDINPLTIGFDYKPDHEVQQGETAEVKKIQ